MPATSVREVFLCWTGDIKSSYVLLVIFIGASLKKNNATTTVHTSCAYF